MLYTQMLVGLEPSSGPHDRDLTAHTALEHEEGRPEDNQRSLTSSLEVFPLQPRSPVPLKESSKGTKRKRALSLHPGIDLDEPDFLGAAPPQRRQSQTVHFT